MTTNGFCLPAERAREMLICELKMGSLAYGLSVPGSDVDIRGIYVPREEALTPLQKPTILKDESRGDAVYYPLSGFLQKLYEGRPEPLEMLWVISEDSRFDHSPLSILADRRDLFVTRLATSGYMGLANQYVSRFTHNHWASAPKQVNPRKVDYLVEILGAGGSSQGHPFEWENHVLKPLGNDLFALIPAHGLSAISPDGRPNQFREERVTGDPVTAFFFDRKAYSRDKENYKQWSNWIKQGRRVTEFDYKSAMHAIRCYRIVTELSAGKGLHVHRADSEELLAIRNLEFNEGQVRELLEESRIKAEDALDCTVLADSPDWKDAISVFGRVSSAVGSLTAPPPEGGGFPIQRK